MKIRLFTSLVLAGFCFVASADESGEAGEPDERVLSFYHTHTGENLEVTYYRNGDYDAEALDAIDEFLADFRTGDIAEMDPKLMDLLHDLRIELSRGGTYEVISAYRSPKTNAMLRSQSSGVARNSQHLLGNAIDVRLRGVTIEELRDSALAKKRGGVGFYKRSNFVHLDTGRVRRW